MASVIPYLNNTIELSLHATQEGTNRVNVFHYGYNPGNVPTVAQLLEIASNWWTQCGLPYKNMANQSTNFDYVHVRDIHAAGRNEADFFIGQPAPGLGTGTADPANAALVISWRSGRAGRAYRGRTYLHSIGENQSVGSNVTSAYLLAAVVVANAVRTFVNSGGSLGVNFIVASLTKQLQSVVTAHIVDIAIDSMRRRLINRGR